MSLQTSDQSEKLEESLKSRGRQVFEESPKKASASVAKKSVQDYLRETKAAPLTGGLKTLVLGASAAVALQLVAVVGASMLRPEPPPKGVAVAQPNPTTSKPAEDEPITSLVNVPINLKKAGEPTQKKDEPTKAEPPKPEGPPPYSGWAVTADTSDLVKELTKIQDASIPVPSGSGLGGKVLFPTTPSPFVVVGENVTPNEVREVWDLRTRRRAGAVRGELKVMKPQAVSPDGTYFAGRGWKGDEVGLWTLSSGSAVLTITFKGKTPEFIDFATGDLLLIGDLGRGIFQLWNQKDGKQARAIEVVGGVVPTSPTLSTGRKYLAVIAAADRKLKVFDLTTGAQVGDEPPPPKLGPESRCLGLSFSPDGKELAGLFVAPNGSRVICWDAANGKVAADVRLTEPVEPVESALGGTIQWQPGREGWLVLGQALIDRPSGRRLWSFPPDPTGQETSRRLLGENKVVIVTGSGKSRAVRSITLPLDLIARVRTVVRGEGGLADALLTALSQPDVQLARKLKPLEAQAPSWAVPVDATPPMRLVNQLELKSKYEDVHSIRFSGAEAPQAIVETLTADPERVEGGVVQGGRRRGFDRYDLTKGTRLSRGDLPAAASVAAVGTDGSTILLRDESRGERLDLFSSADGRHLYGWKPFEKESTEARAVTWVDYLDKTRVLTLNAAGTLTLWIITPEFRAVWSLPDAFQAPPVFSPNRRVLAGLAAESIRFIDPNQQGKLLGSATIPDSVAAARDELKVAAFRPDGQRLAALLGGNLLVTWDVKTGKPLTSFEIQAQGKSLQWCGDHYLLLDDQRLIDLDHGGMEVWRFAGGKHAERSPDARHWVALKRFKNAPNILIGASLPDKPKELEQVVAQVMNPKSAALWRPGSAVSVNVDAVGPPGDSARFKADLAARLTQALSLYGVSVADGQPVTLVARVVEEPAVEKKDEKKELRLVLPAQDEGPLGKEQVEPKRLHFDLVLIDKEGPLQIVEPRVLELDDLPALKVPAGVSKPGDYLRDQLWAAVADRLDYAAIPAFAARKGKKDFIRFPGYLNLDMVK